MPSTVASLLSALASGLLWLHQRAFFDFEPAAVEQQTTWLRGVRRECRLYADERLSPLREQVLQLVLSPGPGLERLFLLAGAFALLGAFAVVRSFAKCSRRRDVQPVRLSFSHGAEGSGRRIARRIADGAAR